MRRTKWLGKFSNAKLEGFSFLFFFVAKDDMIWRSWKKQNRLALEPRAFTKLARISDLDTSAGSLVHVAW